jgi:Protein of unknown function (DUF2917)
MDLELNLGGICLKQKQVLKVRSGVGHAIVCDSGALWVTQYRDQRDVVLEAGQSFALDRDGLALVQALEPSAITIAPATKGRASPPAALPRYARTVSRLAHSLAWG